MLEGTETPEVMVATVDVLRELNVNHSHILNNYFQVCYIFYFHDVICFCSILLFVVVESINIPVLYFIQYISYIFLLQDIVDILVGWHIDHHQSPEVMKYVSMALRSFSQLWLANVPIAATLLSQFVEDMEDYCEVM